MESIEIGKGMNLHLIKSDKFKTVSVAMLIRRKLDKSEVTKNALIPRVLKRGSVKYPDLQSIYKKTEEMYGAVFEAAIIKKGEEQIIQFYLELLDESEALNDGLEFLKEVTLSPLTRENCFIEEFVSGEKEKLKEHIEGRINNKKEFAKLRCLEEMCGGEPFGIYGDGYISDLDNIDHKNLYKHYMELLKSSPIDFIVIGNCDGADLSNKLKELFAVERTNIIAIPKAKYEYGKQDVRIAGDKQNVQQGKLCVGLRTNVEPDGPDYYALIVANDIYGGGSESKLFNNLREKESLCYYINSFIYRFKSILFVESGIDEKNFDKAVELIMQELKAVKKGKISAKELKKSKISLVKRMKGLLDYPSAIMDFHLGQKMLGDNDSVEQVIEKIEMVAKQDCVKALENIWVDTVYKLLPDNTVSG